MRSNYTLPYEDLCDDERNLRELFYSAKHTSNWAAKITKRILNYRFIRGVTEAERS